MRPKSPLPFVFVLALASGLSGISCAAYAQQPVPEAREQVTIEAPQYVFKKAPSSGRQYNWDRVSISRAVSYSDLDLARPADAAELERRVKEAAQDVCNKLYRRFPRYNSLIAVDRKCVNDAIGEAMVSVRTIVAKADNPQIGNDTISLR